MLERKSHIVVAALCLATAASAALAGYATEVVSYVQGTGLDESDAAYNDPSNVLGAPERMSGEGTDWPSRVSVYSPVFMPNQAVSLGQGGSLTVRFDQPITDDPSHLYGVDLMVFGNAGFILGNFAALRTGTPAALFGPGHGQVEVSADGVNFYTIPNAWADMLFPTQGYLDGGPFDATPGSVEADFFKPVNPALQMSDFSGKTYAEILAMYDGSGGGLPIDIANAVDGLGQPAGLTSASYVRITHVGEDDTTIDAFVAVPEPASIALFAMLGAGLIARRSRGA